MDQAHLIEAMDAVMRRLGGTARHWRTDRLATVIVPGSANVQASFAPVAKYYGAIVTPCPPRRGNRKGAVEAGVKFCCGRWWRTMTATTMAEAQLSLDHFWSSTGDARLRPPGRYLDPVEQTAQRLYSRLINYYLSLHQEVPLDADSFYQWHAAQPSLRGPAVARG